MNDEKMTELVRDALQEWPQEGVRPSPHLADQVLRARRRRKVGGVVGAAVAAAAILGTAVAVPALENAGDGGGVRPAAQATGPDVLAHPDQSPPRDQIAAGKTAVSAFYRTTKVRQQGGDELLTYQWHLLDPATGRYEMTSWAWLDVAPGLKKAAVLEGELPAKRVGLLDLSTGRVERWIKLDRGVASVKWSPEGRRLLATTYDTNPDNLTLEKPYFTTDEDGGSDKEAGPVLGHTGFYAIDVASGASKWRKLPSAADTFTNTREDLEWSHDGSLVVGPSLSSPGRIFYDLDGKRVPAPAAEKYVSYTQAGLSPDGRHVAGGFAGKGGAITSEILDARTGKRVKLVAGQQLLAWADADRLIAWGCDPKKCSGKNEFRNRLQLVSLKSDKVVPLTDFRKASDEAPGRWEPVFSRR
ncbi:WD40 repeat domain-containing protein [Streptomyces sp. LX-29]|uniref:WD40 repeat domain-containing protein n=1 Tax=Streptomyces sp. LX-29 TaxID=2900152 RepID=UPI00240D6113|nr:WD40 repeat domain-containing protein [Streptomyces sp. LX-29]WFB10159.1 WD40 repeat domain-containing protein [Streptomyces sp. LX-29]